jgi:prepilin-type N-terminal cleavage/methylation domain-containing protein
MNKLLKQAFTLIELLVVIAIIGILSGLIVVSMSGVTEKANIAKAQVFSNSLRNSLMANIVGEWKFDGATVKGAAGDNNVVDTWGGLNNGIIPAAAGNKPTAEIGSDCVSGSCLSFDGGDYVGTSSTNFPTANTARTLSVWVKRSAIPAIASYVICYGTAAAGNTFAFDAYAPASTRARVVSYSNDWITNYTVPMNEWHLIVVTYDGVNLLKLYVDGNLQDSTNSYTLNTVLGTSQIGSWFGNVYNFQGLIDDLRLYKTSILTSQIKEQYYVGLNKLLNSGGITREEYLSRVLDLNNSYAKR